MSEQAFTADMLTKKRPSGIDAETTLAHFAIVTYCVDPGLLRPHLHERFEPDCISLEDGAQKALISVVPFYDQDFRFSRCPWPALSFGQTNYRAYVTDRETGEHVAWFFGTALASASIVIPRIIWRLPWHPAKITFNTSYDAEAKRYTQYEMNTRSRWAPGSLELEDTGVAVDALQGFPDLEEGLALLTHPLKGYYLRRDGALGSYAIWHDRLRLTEGRVKTASFPLLSDLDLVETGDVSAIHSVLIQPETNFTIYLPPKKLEHGRR